ncbi:MAG: transcription antitermination factor NusB [Bacilli bacterium]
MENISNSRNRQQEVAMEIMYSFLMKEDAGTTIDVENSISDICEKPYSECDLFLKEVLIKSLKNEKEIIDYISLYLKKWKFERLNACVQSILIISVCNYKYVKETDKAVIIDVAVKLAKKYGSKDDYKFVNAVLDNCLNDKLFK